MDTISMTKHLFSLAVWLFYFVLWLDFVTDCFFILVNLFFDHFLPLRLTGGGVGAYPRMHMGESRLHHLIAWPYMSIWGFGTLLKSISADLWGCHCTPYNQNTSHVLPTLELEPAPSASQPSTLQAELLLFLISVFELQYGIFYCSKWYLGYKHDFTKSVQFRVLF